MSTKKFPSRKIRGRIQNVASLWIGRPFSLIEIVTSAALHWDWVVLPALQPETGATLSTFPTLIPAIRTSDSGRSPLALEKIAWIVYGLASGLANLEYAP